MLKKRRKMLKKRRKMNKKGNFLVGLLMMVVSLFFFLALTPAITSMFGVSKGSDSANCPGYVDPNSAILGANNKSYSSTLSTDTLSCTVLNFGPGMIILSVIFSAIIGVITGKLGQQQQQETYSQYGGY